MELIETIREYYATIIDNKLRLIEGMPDDYPAYVYKRGNEYGVCIPCDSKCDFSEHFNDLKIRTIDLIFNGVRMKMIFLSSKNYTLREQFSIISANFVDPGKDGTRRTKLLLDPEKWVSSWVDLLGNSKKFKNSFAVLGELYALKYLFKSNKSIIWTGAFAGTHDLESPNMNYELKKFIIVYL